MKKDNESLDFEKAMRKLESTVEALEGGTLSLDESLKRFEEAIALVRLCSDALEQAKQRVRVLTEGEDGAVREEPFPIEHET